MKHVVEQFVGRVLWGPAGWMAIGVVIGCSFMAGVFPVILRCYDLLAGRRFASKRKVEVTADQETKEMVQLKELRMLVEQLDEMGNTTARPWELAVDKKSSTASYSARRRDPEDGGPTQILSTTVFENCSTELARDFYMDGEFRKQWDSTLVLQEQLDMCEETGTETGRVVKKFPFLTAREYVLDWRVWEGEDKTFYCLIKACEHKLAPRQNKLKRVQIYKSGWRIRKVPGRNACEIKMVHQEDLCMQREMGKMAFDRAIWGYVRKMDTNLRKFALQRDRFCQGRSAVSFAHKVSPEMLPSGSGMSLMCPSAMPPTTRRMWCNGCGSLEKRPHIEAAMTRKRLVKGFLLVSGAVFFSQASASWGAKIAAACLVKRLLKPPIPYKRSKLTTP